MKRTHTIVVGAGQCGLAMSHELAKAGVEHLILERGAAAGWRWRTQSWDSLRLLTPNWMNGIAGAPYAGDAPDAFLSARQFCGRFDAVVESSAPPLHTETTVLSAKPAAGGWRVQTDQGAVDCDALVMAKGACAVARVPPCAGDAPRALRQLTPKTYKRPADAPGESILVVGASASGQQIARELQAAGRRVTLAVGSHLRLPRRYRGIDIVTWLDVLGLLDTPADQIDDLERVRRAPSLTVSGSDDGATLDLNALQAMGVEITGRLAAIRDGRAMFSGGLHNLCAAADQKLARLLASIDAWVDKAGLGTLLGPAVRIEPTRTPSDPRLFVDLRAFDAIVWATGFTPDFSWLDAPVFDRKGRLEHTGGGVAPRLYVMGLPYMRTRRSSHIDGATRDANALCTHLAATSSRKEAA